MERTLLDYTIVIRPDDNGTFVAYVPAIDGCHAWGSTPDEARAELADVFAMIAEEYASEGKSLPEDVEGTSSSMPSTSRSRPIRAISAECGRD